MAPQSNSYRFRHLLYTFEEIFAIRSGAYFIVYWYAIFDRVLSPDEPESGAFHTAWNAPLCFMGLRIEVDAVGYPAEHVAVGDTIVLGHAHADAVASGVDHGLEVAGGVDPVVDGALGGVGCAGEHGEVIAEAIGVAGVDSGLALLRSVMPGVAPVGADLGGIHQGLIDR